MVTDFIVADDRAGRREEIEYLGVFKIGEYANSSYVCKLSPVPNGSQRRDTMVKKIGEKN
jgi:hypothetical protein